MLATRLISFSARNPLQMAVTYNIRIFAQIDSVFDQVCAIETNEEMQVHQAPLPIGYGTKAHLTMTDNRIQRFEFVLLFINEISLLAANCTFRCQMASRLRMSSSMQCHSALDMLSVMDTAV